MKIAALLIILSVFLIKSSSALAQTINLGSKQQYGIRISNDLTVGRLVASALQIAVIFAGLAVLVFIVWGAFDWITAGGDKEKINGARRKITNALIGLLLLALASFIVALFGDIVGINPFNMGIIPQLGQPTNTAPGTTPLPAPVTGP